MATWEIMLGFQAFTALASLAVVVHFMFSEGSLDEAAAPVAGAPCKVAEGDVVAAAV